ncbi:MAG TPA: hypothetical protein VFV19_03060 [Candidatus Polarisedimenticolaceae bacterium]|nr:hypothetical protein [Candidatus Polarisedimenticolaceae bacterium]
MKAPVLVLAATCLATAAFAGRIPIGGAPMTISQSGSYVLVADIDAIFQPAIKLSGEVNADIDLAGHTITAYGAPVVQVRATHDDDSCRTLTLRNGVVAGGYGLVSMTGGPDACRPTLTIDGAQFQSADLYVEDTVITLTRSVFTSGGIFVVNNVGGPQSHVRGNRLIGGDIVVLGDDGGNIVGNVSRGGSIMVRGNSERDTAHILIASNTIGGNLEIGGENAGEGASDIYVARNSVNGYVTLTQTSDAKLDLNRIGRCGPGNTSIGVNFGTAGWIDANAFQGGCAHGIVFDELSSGNEYSGNTFRVVVPEPVLDYGTDNIDGDVRSQEGDGVLPQ